MMLGSGSRKIFKQNAVKGRGRLKTGLKIVLIGTLTSSALGFRRELIQDLVSRGHSVYVLAINYDQASTQKIRSLGAVPVPYKFSRTGLNPIKDLINTLYLAKELWRIKPDRVLSYFAKPVIFGTLAASLAGIKQRFAMLEGLGAAFTEQPEKASLRMRFIKKTQCRLYKLALPLAKRVIFLNRDDADELINIEGIRVNARSILGPIGLDLKMFPYSIPPVDPVRFVFVGRLLRDKGVYEYIAAASQLKADFPDVIFSIIGGLDTDNPRALSAEDLAAIVAEGGIEYCGEVDNMAHHLAASSVFVLPSYREGYPRSTQEAMAIGRPIITTDVPGCRETVNDGVNGFLIPPWQVEVLVDKMRYFIEHKHEIVVMGRQSYQFAKDNFDVTKVNDKLIKLMDL